MQSFFENLLYLIQPLIISLFHVPSLTGNCDLLQSVLGEQRVRGDCCTGKRLDYVHLKEQLCWLLFGSL